MFWYVSDVESLKICSHIKLNVKLDKKKVCLFENTKYISGITGTSKVTDKLSGITIKITEVIF